MTTGNDELNTLGYVSSAPDFGIRVEDAQNTQDEADLPTLTLVLQLLTNRKQYYLSTDSLSIGEMTIENQLIVNKKVLFHIQELEGLVEGAIKRAKEHINERNRQ